MDSEKKATFSDWMKIPFERLHQASDFDEYACSPPDATEFMGSCESPMVNKHTDNKDKLNLIEKLSQESFHKPAKMMSGPVADVVSRGLSAPSSIETSPSVTPQGSPFTVRKTVATSEDGGHNKTNTKKWFYSGFFGSDITEGSNCHYSETKRSKSTFRKFNVSNFDINVVGPTSW